MPTGDKWNDWSMKVLEELTELYAKQEQLTKELERSINMASEDKKEILSKLDTINALLNGDESPEKGMIVRLDRLERSEQNRTWLLRTTIIAAIGALLSTIASWFKQ